MKDTRGTFVFEDGQSVEVSMTFENNFFQMHRNNTAFKRVMLHSIEGVAADGC